MRKHRGGLRFKLAKIFRKRDYMGVSKPGPAGQGSKKAFEPLAISFTQNITSSFTIIFSTIIIRMFYRYFIIKNIIIF